jgi:hypothetical protein
MVHRFFLRAVVPHFCLFLYKYPGKPVAIVTGGNKGIGFHIAKQLLDTHRVVIATRD